MRRTLHVPEHVVRRAHAEGGACAQWLDAVPELVAQLEGEWGIAVGEPFSGGTASLVIAATTQHGAPAILKVVMPAHSMYDSIDVLPGEAGFLRAAKGRGAVRLLDADLDRGALLLERAGRQLAGLGRSPRAELDAICSCLEQAWSSEPDPTMMHGDEKGRWLADFAVRTWEQLGHPCSARVVERAVEYAARRIDEFDESHAVLVHGDAHQWNTLESLAADGTYRLVDPDGLYAEREYDLAILMREGNDELLAGDARIVGWERARYLADRTGADVIRIWEWGFLERVTSGLLLLHQGQEGIGRDSLAVAEAWCSGA